MHNSTTTSNRLQIANSALIQLNLTPINSFELENENTNAIDEVKRAMYHLLDSTIYSCLEKHYFEFAITSAPLIEHSTSKHSYYYPPDCLRLVGVGLEKIDCCTPCALSTQSSSPTNKHNSLIDDTNSYLKTQHSDRYISRVSFTLVNSMFNFRVHSPVADECCCSYYDRVFYVHSKIEEMRMPSSFKDVCAQKLLVKLLPLAKQDPQGMLVTAAEKKADLMMFREIEREYSEFKYRVKFNCISIQRELPTRFKTSPFI